MEKNDSCKKHIVVATVIILVAIFLATCFVLSMLPKPEIECHEEIELITVDAIVGYYDGSSNGSAEDIVGWLCTNNVEIDSYGFPIQEKSVFFESPSCNIGNSCDTCDCGQCAIKRWVCS